MRLSQESRVDKKKRANSNTVGDVDRNDTVAEIISVLFNDKFNVIITTFKAKTVGQMYKSLF